MWYQGKELFASTEWAFSVMADRTQSRRGGGSPAGSEPHRCGLSSQVRARQCGPSSCSSSRCSRRGKQTVRALTQLHYSLLPAVLSTQPPPPPPPPLLHRLHPPYFLLHPLLSNTCPQPNLPNALFREHWCNRQ